MCLNCPLVDEINHLMGFVSLISIFRTIGMDDLYSESKWVLTFILVQIQVCHVSRVATCKGVTFQLFVPQLCELF
jgi:hypothetical protein